MSGQAGSDRTLGAVLLFVGGLLVLGAALYVTVFGGRGEASSPDQVVATAEPGPAGQEPTGPLDDGTTAATTPEPAETATEAVTVEPVGPTTTPRPKAPPELPTDFHEPPDDEAHPESIAARYVQASAAVDYRVEPGEWLVDADYLSQDYAEQLAATFTGDRGWDELVEARFRSVPGEVLVATYLEDDTSISVLARWSSSVFTDGQKVHSGTEQGSLVMLELFDGEWKVTGESHPG